MQAEEYEVRPRPCDAPVYHYGKHVCTVRGESSPIERLVEELRRETGIPIEWYYASREVAKVIYLGGPEERQRILDVVGRVSGGVQILDIPAA